MSLIGSVLPSGAGSMALHCFSLPLLRAGSMPLHSLAIVGSTPGAKPIIFNTISTLCEEGDEVACPDPGFNTYATTIEWAGSTLAAVALGAELWLLHCVPRCLQHWLVLHAGFCTG